MPVITCSGGHLSKEMKEELIEKLTNSVVESTKTPSDFFTFIVQEFSDDNLGVSGEVFSAIKARIQA